MRRAMGVMVGLLVMIGLLIGSLTAEATLNSCSRNGTYILSGLGEAAGFLEVVGSLIFTPNGACSAGTLGGFVTIRHQGAAPTPFTPTTVYSFTVAGGTLGTDMKLRGELFANYLNTSGGASDLTIKLKYGVSTVASFKVPAISSNNAATKVYIQFFLANMFGNTGTQHGGFVGVIDDTCLACGAGGRPLQQTFSATGFELTNSSFDVAISITVTHGVASPSKNFQKQFAILELL